MIIGNGSIAISVPQFGLRMAFRVISKYIRITAITPPGTKLSVPATINRVNELRFLHA